MSHSYKQTKDKHNQSSGFPFQYQQDIILTLRQAYFYNPRVPIHTCCKVRFYHLGKSYSLSVFGKPDREIITLLYQHSQGKRYGARSSTESIAKGRELNRKTSYRRSKSTSSSSSSSQAPAASSRKQRQSESARSKRSRSTTSSSSSSLLVPSTSGYELLKTARKPFGPEKSPLVVRVDDLPRSSTPVRTSTPDTEPLSNRSSPRSRLSTPARRLFSSSSSDDNSGIGRQPVNTSRAGQSLTDTLENRSPSVLEDSQEARFFLWDTETIPVKIIYDRVGHLYERHIREEFKKPKAKRFIKNIESFTDSAEEQLVTERLAFEYYQAKRRPFSRTPLCEKPKWYYNAYNPTANTKSVSNLLSVVNQIRSANCDSNLDNFVEFYWYLNHKGHSLYLSELANQQAVTYSPSLYRERILAQEIELATKFRQDNICQALTRNQTF